MASQKISSVSNITELLSAVPDASALAEQAMSSEVARERRAEQEERAATKAAKEAHTIALVQSLTQYMLGLFASGYASSAEQGHSYMRVFKCKPPMKDKTTHPETGEECMAFRYPATETHWAGLGEDGRPLPSEEGGAPFVMLFQGPKPRDSKLPDPKLIPGGKTVPMRMKEEFAKAKKGGYDVQCTFSKGELSVWVIWNQADWRKYHDRQSGPRPSRAAAAVSSAPMKPQMGLDEFRAQQRHRATPRRPLAKVHEDDDE